MTPVDAESCGCVWGPEPRYGAVTVIEPCAEQADLAAARERAIDTVANDNLLRRMLDIELDNVLRRRTR